MGSSAGTIRAVPDTVKKVPGLAPVLLQKKVSCKNMTSIFSQRSWSQRIETTFRSKIFKICIWCDNLPMPQSYTSRILANVSHHIIKLWDNIVNVWPTLKIYPHSFSNKIMSLRARITARQPIEARACKGCGKKNDAKIFWSQKILKEFTMRFLLCQRKSHATFSSTRGIICYSTLQFETKSPPK